MKNDRAPLVYLALSLYQTFCGLHVVDILGGFDLGPLLLNMFIGNVDSVLLH